MRRSWLRCCSAPSNNLDKGTSSAHGKALVPSSVVRSLYRAILKEAHTLDKNPLLKTLFPLNQAMQDLMSAERPLQQPNGEKYTAAVKRVFRAGPLSSAGVNTAFDALTRLRYHSKVVSDRLKESTKDRDQLMEALKGALPKDGNFYARVITPPDTPAASPTVGSATPPPAYVALHPDAPRDGPIKVVPKGIVRKRPVEIKPGVGLIAHPLSSSHSDRRVMLVTSRTPHTTTALVLDMLYSYPLSAGNPMFPEVFWGHEIYNGGYLHVDFTMPPTACVTVLHTLPPPSKIPEKDGSAYNNAWLRWMKNPPADGTGRSATALSPVEHHELLCKPLIRGTVRADGTVEPTLYCSPVEALPYLATLVPGQPRSSLRMYWGCMRWPSAQITQEVQSGHWIPVELSPSFFGAYPLTPATQSQRKRRSSSPPGDDTTAATQPALLADDRFPTLEELAIARELRLKHQNTDAVSPQIFPPDQPMCRREALWDQILLTLGGEYEHLVGCSNPFASKPQGSRAPPVEIVSQEGPEGILPQDILPLLLGDSDDDDGDDD